MELSLPCCHCFAARLLFEDVVAVFQLSNWLDAPLSIVLHFAPSWKYFSLTLPWDSNDDNWNLLQECRSAHQQPMRWKQNDGMYLWTSEVQPISSKHTFTLRQDRVGARLEPIRLASILEKLVCCVRALCPALLTGAATRRKKTYRGSFSRCYSYAGTFIWACLSILAEVLTVSPNSWKRARSPRRTPAVTGPEWRPNRMARSPVSGPPFGLPALASCSCSHQQTWGTKQAVGILWKH